MPVCGSTLTKVGPRGWVLWLELKPREAARGSGLSTGLCCVILSSPGPSLDNEGLDLHNLHIPPETSSQPRLSPSDQNHPRCASVLFPLHCTGFPKKVLRHVSSVSAAVE